MSQNKRTLQSNSNAAKRSKIHTTNTISTATVPSHTNTKSKQPLEFNTLDKCPNKHKNLNTTDEYLVSTFTNEKSIIAHETEWLDNVHEFITTPPGVNNSYRIRSAIQNKEFCIFTGYGTLFHFKNSIFPIQHSLYLDATSNYYIPCIFLFKHAACDTNYSCDITHNTQIKTHQTVIEKITNFLGISSDDSKTIGADTNIFYKKCTFYLIVPIKVSLPVYDEMFQALNSTLSTFKPQQSRYLPLPNIQTFSHFESGCTKSERSYDTNKWISYDLPLKTNYIQDNTKVTIATIHRPMVQTFSLWEDTKYYIQYDSAEKPQISTEIPPQFIRFQNNYIAVTNHKLDTFLRKFRSHQMQVSCSLTPDVLKKKFSDYGPSTLQEHFWHICTLIAKTAGRTTNNGSFAYIYQLMIGPQNTCKNFIHLYFALINYFNKMWNLNINAARQLIRLFIFHSKSNDEADHIIKYSVNMLDKVPDAFITCLDFFSDYESIFIYFASMQYYNRADTDDHFVLLKKCLDYEIDPDTPITDMSDKLVRIFPLLYPSFRMSADEICTFDLTRFIFIKDSQNKLFDNTIFSNLKFYILTNTINRTVTGTRLENAIKVAWVTYMTKVNIVANPRFGRYEHFYNTDLGVFVNLTGLYATRSPFLYFEKVQSKSFAINPLLHHNNSNNSNNSNNNNNNTNELSNINYELLSTHKYMANIITTLNSLTIEPFFYIVLFPGLLSLHRIFFNELEDINKIVQLLDQKLTNENVDCILNEFAQIMLHFPLNTDKVCHLAYFIMQIQRYNTPEKRTRDITEHTILHQYSISNQSDTWTTTNSNETAPKIDYTTKTGQQIVETIVSQYPKKITKSAFVLAYIYCILILRKQNNSDCFIVKHFGITSFDQLDTNIAKWLNAREQKQKPNKSFIVGSDKFADGIMYDPTTDANSNINVQRGMYLCFRKQLISPIFCALSFIFQALAYDMCVIKEFILHFSTINVARNVNKKYTLLRGAKHSGKSTFCNAMQTWHGSSHFALTSKARLPSGSESAAPQLILTYISYLTTISEAKYLDASLLKSVTGDDSTMQRELYGNNRRIEPVTFLLAVSNEYPNIVADDAVFDRTVIFLFGQTCVDMSTINKIENNFLILHLRNKAIRKRIPEKDLVNGLANVFVATFLKYRTTAGIVVSTVKNAISKFELERFMDKNSNIHKIINIAQLKFDSAREITYDAFHELVTIVLGKNPNIKFTVAQFFTQFNDTYEYMIVRKNRKIVKYIGIGATGDQACIFNVIEDKGSHIENKDLIAALIQLKVPKNKRDEHLNRFANLYKDYYSNGKFLNLKLVLQ